MTYELTNLVPSIPDEYNRDYLYIPLTGTVVDEIRWKI